MSQKHLVVTESKEVLKKPIMKEWIDREIEMYVYVCVYVCIADLLH